MSVSATTLRVVVADDEPSVRDLLGVTLGMESDIEIVGEAKDGHEAVALVEQHRPDAVLLDLMMPVVRGLDVIPHLRECSPETKIIVFTAQGTEQSRDEAMRRGAHAYLDKTNFISDLSPVLHRICRDG